MPNATTIATLRDILEVSAAMFRVSADELSGPARWVPLTEYRHATWAASRRLTEASYPAIAHVYGRDHSSVMTGCRRAERYHQDLVTAVVDAWKTSRDFGGAPAVTLEAAVASLRSEVKAQRAELAALRAELAAVAAGVEASRSARRYQALGGPAA